MRRFTVTIPYWDCDDQILNAIEEMYLEEPGFIAFESEFRHDIIELTFDYDGDPSMICAELRLRYGVRVELR